MTLQSTVESILGVSGQFIIYSSFVILFTGLFGHAMNILVFTSTKIFRRNQSAFYLTSDSVINSILLLFPLLFRILSLGYSIPSIKTSVVICKLRLFLGQGCTALSLTIVCFAAFDQYLATNHRPYLRQLSTLKLASYLVFSAAVIWILHGIPFIIFSIPVPYYQCYTLNEQFANYIKYMYYPILTGLLPIVISVTFATLAYSNVRRIVRRQLTVSRRKLDKQLTAMIFVRVAILVVVTLPYVIERMYLLTITDPENISIKNAIVSLLDGIILSIYYLNYSCSFYIFSLSSARFRRQTKYVLKKYWRKYFRRGITDNQISPMPTLSSARFDEE